MSPIREMDAMIHISNAVIDDDLGKQIGHLTSRFHQDEGEAMLEVIAVAYDGTHGAERELSDLRSKRDDPWLSEVSIIEHHKDGRYSVKAKDPDVDSSDAGKGAAIGGLTGLLIGAIGGPLGLVFWTGVGALTGGAIGAGKDSAFLPLVDELKARIGPGASVLVLVGETSTIDDLAAAVNVDRKSILRRPLTNEQAKELADASS